jgi:hypothetical protein
MFGGNGGLPIFTIGNPKFLKVLEVLVLVVLILLLLDLIVI